MAKQGLTHVDQQGKAVMVDVSAKDTTRRTALAGGSIVMTEETLRVVEAGGAEKGDVLGTARLAGIMAAKRTGELIPLCHSLGLESCAVDFEIRRDPPRIDALCRVKASAKTGAEMEALTGVSAALLTIYDMCKARDRAMVMENIRVLEKSGGKSGPYVRREGSGGPPDG
ncbi:MAG: cyclic pyranopterin monophosphate synthase MoaC [Treponema sp.]|jgi:cyclic pyranopterin phosphate synthase|nr:cyclic pyranopterin monophosphate synthase MoaC [Treponema sp.]